MDNRAVEITIDELEERLDWLCWECGSDLHIIEQFPKRGLVSYVIGGLSMEYDNECVYCNGAGDILYSNLSVLLGFMKNRLRKIAVITSDDYFEIRLEFADGLVLIEKQCNLL